MRYILATPLLLTILLNSACTIFQAKQPPPPPEPPIKLVVPVGKHWQVMEEAPTLTNERHEQTLPFQREQSLQPPGAPPVPPEQRKIETPTR